MQKNATLSLQQVKKYISPLEDIGKKNCFED
jgi:hypothetical protein